MKILKLYFKVKDCEVNKENNLHIANSSCNPNKLLKEEVKIRKISPYYISNAVEIC
jgi:hypothetical protein